METGGTPMPKFIMTYHNARQPSSPEEGKAMQARWQEWMGANAAALVEPQNPIGKTWTVDAGGAREGTAHPTMGYSILEAADMEAALAIAKTCPFTAMGTLEISEIKQMG